LVALLRNYVLLEFPVQDRDDVLLFIQLYDVFAALVVQEQGLVTLLLGFLRRLAAN
jgi:hypothetical protein